MARLLVTLGSEHNMDWVQTPDGQKFSLGTCSPAKFLAALTPARGLRRALDSLLMYGEVAVPVDLDQMWDLLKPVRVRFGTVGLFMPPLGRETRISDMSQFESNLQAAEKALSVLTQKAASGRTAEVRQAMSAFVTAANKIKSPNQSQNSTY